jgi:hypothetical protein
MTQDLREAIARIVDPVAYWDLPIGGPEPNHDWFDRDHALAKADLILALPQLSDLTVRCGELEGALEPFAAFFDRTKDMGGNFPKAGPFYTLMSMNGPVELSIEHFRRARQALAAKAEDRGVSRELSPSTNAAPSASGLADPTPSSGEGSGS